jgi:hypothetical protein
LEYRKCKLTIYAVNTKFIFVGGIFRELNLSFAGIQNFEPLQHNGDCGGKPAMADYLNASPKGWVGSIPTT